MAKRSLSTALAISALPVLAVVLAPPLLGYRSPSQAELAIMVIVVTILLAAQTARWHLERSRKPAPSAESGLYLLANGTKERGKEEPAAELMHKAIALSSKTVGEIMVPRPDMCCVRSDATLSEILETAGRTAHTRLPVYETDLDHILGFIHAKDLLKIAGERECMLDEYARGDFAPTKLLGKDLMRPILAAPESKSIEEMLRAFQRQKTHVAIIFDEFGGTAGMVTINDLLEELVGEIFDEWRESEPEIEPLPDGTVRLNGRVAINEVNTKFKLELPDHEFNTIAGLVFGQLGRTPNPGDETEFEGTHFCVEATNGRRATQILMRLDSLPS